MKQRLVGIGTLGLQLACVAMLNSSGPIRTLLYRQLYPLVPVDAHELAAPPSALAARGYLQDDPIELASFRAVAQSATRSATSDGQRLRQIGDALYRMRAENAAVIAGGREQGVHALLAKMQQGQHGLCGHMTMVFAAMWRSLGRDFREVRFSASDDAAWYAAHYGIEVYLPDTRQWVYYDVGLNGYAVDGTGQPLSLAALDQRLASGTDVAVVASSQYQDWDTTTFMDVLRQQPLQVFSLDNRLRPLDPDKRFGSLHFAHSVLSKLPRPLDKVVDAVTGDAGPRWKLSTPARPSARAALHLSASPDAQAPSP